jgi:hypothetical protein
VRPEFARGEVRIVLSWGGDEARLWTKLRKQGAGFLLLRPVSRSGAIASNCMARLTEGLVTYIVPPKVALS